MQLSHPVVLGRLCGFSCSVGTSLPGLRLHLYTGGPILPVTPLYRQAAFIHFECIPLLSGEEVGCPHFPDHP